MPTLAMSRAHAAIAAQKGEGLLTSEPCEECGAARTVAHHDDYAKPLEVRWLCHRHHYDWHRLHKAKNRDFVGPVPVVRPLNAHPIWAARVNAGLSREKVAVLVQSPVTAKTIERWEKRLTPLRRWRARQLADIYRVDLSDLEEVS